MTGGIAELGTRAALPVGDESPLGNLSIMSALSTIIDSNVPMDCSSGEHGLVLSGERDPGDDLSPVIGFVQLSEDGIPTSRSANATKPTHPVRN